jgi:hypothetical protein
MRPLTMTDDLKVAGQHQSTAKKKEQFALNELLTDRIAAIVDSYFWKGFSFPRRPK